MSYELIPNEHIKIAIFDLLDLRTKLNVASMVCKEWRMYCYRTVRRISYCQHNKQCRTHLPDINDDIMCRLIDNTADHIQSIHLCHIDDALTHQSLSHISHCTELTSFLLCCSSINDDDAAQLKHLNKLVDLDVSFTNITSLDHFANCKGLRRLHFIPSMPINQPIPFRFDIIRSFTLLTKLDLQDISVADDGDEQSSLFSIISELPELNYLRIRRSSFFVYLFIEAFEMYETRRNYIMVEIEHNHRRQSLRFLSPHELEKIKDGPFQLRSFHRSWSRKHFKLCVVAKVVFVAMSRIAELFFALSRSADGVNVFLRHAFRRRRRRWIRIVVLFAEPQICLVWNDERRSTGISGTRVEDESIVAEFVSHWVQSRFLVGGFISHLRDYNVTQTFDVLR
eukprot:TRINITY_DN4864_c0_g1_i1.p1 TRINITY_DN4864_c0_g1~~TRINITY_DN4864_c0_g1_i1.p1  ORF type:complete len:396 (+),score=58.07 TRINITY_DN4864_c0_g1_i1:68-1255(+)